MKSIAAISGDLTAQSGLVVMISMSKMKDNRLLHGLGIKLCITKIRILASASYEKYRFFCSSHLLSSSVIRAFDISKTIKLQTWDSHCIASHFLSNVTETR